MRTLHGIAVEFSAPLLSFVERIQSATTVDQAWGAFNEVTGQLGFKSCTYGFWMPQESEDLKQRMILLSRHRPDWAARYTQKGYAEHDPAVNHCRFYDDRCMLWGDARDATIRTPLSAAFDAEAGEFGLRCGITFPLRDATGLRIGGVGFAAEEQNDRAFRAYAKEIHDQLWGLGNVLHARVQTPEVVVSLGVV